MRKDWLARFLPLWALGTLVWFIAGFVLAPDAFRLSLFTDDGAVWQTGSMSTLVVNWRVAHLLALIVAPPVVLALVAVTIAAVQNHRRLRHQDKPLFK